MTWPWPRACFVVMVNLVDLSELSDGISDNLISTCRRKYPTFRTVMKSKQEIMNLNAASRMAGMW